MKQLSSFLLLVAILATAPLHAQTFGTGATSSFVVWTVEGKPFYTEKGSTHQKNIFPGTSIPENATVHLSDQSSTRLVKPGELLFLSGKLEQPLSANLKKYSLTISSATAPFFERLIASVPFHKAKPTKNDSGSGYGDKSKKKADDSGSGYGDKSKKKADDSGSGYGQKKINKKKAKAVLSPLKADAIYKSCKKQQKLLMQAALLENAGLLEEAEKRYKTASSKRQADPLANQMYAAFLSR